MEPEVKKCKRTVLQKTTSKSRFGSNHINSSECVFVLL